MKKTSLLLLILILVFYPFRLKSAESGLDQQEIIKQQKAIDSLSLIIQIDKVKSSHDYIEILEKTNNQLSLWWNPFSVAIGLLTILFAMLAIVTTFLIFRQSREYKQLIADSLSQHNLTIENFVLERKKQMDLLLANTNQSIEDLKMKVSTEKDASIRRIFEDYISKLETQRASLVTYDHVFEHKGWEPFDVPVDFHVSTISLINIKINLYRQGQPFTIYFRVTTNKGIQVWLGFAGNYKKSKNLKTVNEYTLHRDYEGTEVNFSENLNVAFQRGFPELISNAVSISLVRLRGGPNDPDPVVFSFRFSNQS